MSRALLPTGLSGVIAIAAAHTQSLALRSDGGTRVHLTGAGSCELTAFQPGNANFDARLQSPGGSIAPAPCKVPEGRG
jgi:hypothetical protein